MNDPGLLETTFQRLFQKTQFVYAQPRAIFCLPTLNNQNHAECRHFGHNKQHPQTYK